MKIEFKKMIQLRKAFICAQSIQLTDLYAILSCYNTPDKGWQQVVIYHINDLTYEFKEVFRHKFKTPKFIRPKFIEYDPSYSVIFFATQELY
jgi:hypothetical protein